MCHQTSFHCLHHRPSWSETSWKSPINTVEAKSLTSILWTSEEDSSNTVVVGIADCLKFEARNFANRIELGQKLVSLRHSNISIQSKSQLPLSEQRRSRPRKTWPGPTGTWRNPWYPCPHRSTETYLYSVTKESLQCPISSAEQTAQMSWIKWEAKDTDCRMQCDSNEKLTGHRKSWDKLTTAAPSLSAWSSSSQWI